MASSIRTKLILILSLILFSGFFATSYFSYTVSKENIHKSIIENNLPLSRDNIYSEIQKDMARPIFVSSLMANDTFLKDWVIAGEEPPETIKKYLGEIKDKYGFSSSFFVSDISRNYYHFNGILKEISPDDPHDIWYYTFKNKNLSYDLDVDTNEAAKNHLTIFINHRLTDYLGQFLGVVGVGLDFDSVAVLLREYQEKYNRNVYMVDAQGLVQVHTDKTKIESLSIHQIPGMADIAPKILDRYDAPEFFEYDTKGRHILLTSRYIKELGWFLMVEQDETRALESVRNTLFKNLFISVVITLITLIFATLVINHFQKQLETMAMVDPLTHAFNRNEFEQRFKFMTEKNRRISHSMCMVLFDIDDLKSINDTHGHLTGDQVIQLISKIAAKTIRSHDLLVRWGGDEFIILVLADLETTRQVVQRLGRAINSIDFQPEGATEPLQISISCGVALYTDGQSLDDFLLLADRAMYQAKAQGKNRIVESEVPNEN